MTLRSTRRIDPDTGRCAGSIEGLAGVAPAPVDDASGLVVTSNRGGISDTLAGLRPNGAAG